MVRGDGGVFTMNIAMHEFAMTPYIALCPTKMCFWSAATGNSCKRLYAMVPQKRSVLVIDAEKMLEIRTCKIGGCPGMFDRSRARYACLSLWAALLKEQRVYLQRLSTPTRSVFCGCRGVHVRSRGLGDYS